MDVGSSPEKKNSSEYQSGALSFEFFYDNEKLITNCGYYQDFKHKLNIISKSTASHSTISIDDSSSCSFSKTELAAIRDYLFFSPGSPSPAKKL